MKLYLTKWLPNGVRYYVMNLRTWEKKRPGYVFYPDRCLEEIDDNDAKILLEQYKGLLSTKPMKNPESEEEFIMQELTQEQLDAIYELSHKDLNKLGKNEITDYGKLLNLKIPVTISKEKRIAMLEEHVTMLMNGLVKDKELTPAGTDYGE